MEWNTFSFLLPNTISTARSFATHISSNNKDQSSAMMIGTATNHLALEWLHHIFFYQPTQRSSRFRKILNKTSIETYVSQEAVDALHKDGWLYLSTASTLDLSTSNLCFDTICPKIMPSCTMKWHFFQLSTKFVSSQRARKIAKFLRKSSWDDPKTGESSMKTSKYFSTMLVEIAIIHIWQFVSALHNPNDIL